MTGPNELPAGLEANLRLALAQHYEVGEAIGHGASAVVFRAVDLKLRRAVAIKVLRPEVVAESGSARFEREIATVAALSHPHIVALHDSGEAGGLLYYVMPLIEGESLRERLRRERQMPLEEAIQITKDVASALQYAHERGLVHRDVKPENILITGNSASALADFGLASVLSARFDDRLTQSGLAVGTAAYMSPEQASGDVVDARSDQYALACVLYEMLAGVPPFHAATVQGMLARHRGDAPPRVRHARDTTPRGIEDALLKAMSKQPADRFSSVREFVRAIEVALTSETLAAALQERSNAGGHGAVAAAGRFTTRRMVLGAFGVLVLILSVVQGRASLRDQPSAVETDSNLVAVAPFDVFDARDEVWRTGIVDLLSRRFDEAGPLRTVSPSQVLRVFRGRADVASATDLGVATRAGLVIFGQVTRTPRDSVRLTAVMVDLRANRSIEVDLRAAQGAFDHLIDSLSVRLLHELGRTRALAVTPRVSLGTQSFTALKLFLQAEQARRGNNYVQALRLYEDAIASDSDFALAYHGASRSLSITNEFDSKAMWFALQAGRRNHHLADIDSLMVLADSLKAALPTGPVIYDDSALQNLRRRIGALRQASRLKPGDPQVWTGLAEEYMHNGYRVGVTAEQTILTFERATAADAGYAPAYFHMLELALARRTADSVRIIARTFLRAHPNDSRFRAVEDLVSGNAESVARGRRLMLRLPPDSLLSLAYVLRRWYGTEDFAEEAYRALAKLPQEGIDPDTVTFRRWLVLHLLHRGRLTEGAKLNDPPSADPIPLNSLLLGEKGLVRKEALDTAAHAWASSSAVSARVAAATWFGAVGNVSALRGLTVVAKRPESFRSVSSKRNQLVVGYADALIALAERDSVGALRRLRLLPDSLCSWACWPVIRLTSRLLVAMDSAAAAARVLDRHPPTITSTSFVESEWIVERAITARRANDRETASELNQLLARIWRGADSSQRALIALPISR